MAKQLNINLAMTADTSKAKAELQSLQKQLNNLMTSSIKNDNSLGLSPEIQKATQLAAQLKVQLESATSSTGKLDLTKFNESLQKSGLTIKDYRMALTSLGPEGSQAFSQLASSIMQAEVPLKRTNTMLSNFATTLKNTARWQISSSILHGFMGALQGAYGYAQDLNESLNNIRIVTGQSVDQMAKFAEQANKSAKELSTTTTAYSDAALIYYQQGLSDKDVAERTNTTIKLANVSRQSAEEVSSQMTAIWNNFDDGTKSLEYYADVITALGAATASSSSEIAEGLQKFAAVADTVGLSYEKATAALATVVADTRQSADVVGTAFKTIFARVEGLSLGKTLEDGVDLNKYSTALKTVGVNILDSNKQLKNMDTILDELGAKWDSISKGQQVALAQTVAGTRQYTQLISLMNNYDKVQKNQNLAKSSEGTLQKQADTYAESWEAASKRVKAAAQGIYQDLLNDKFFIKMLNWLEKIISFFDSFIKNLGGLKGVLLTLGSILTQVFSSQIQNSVNNIVTGIKNMTPAGRAAAQDLRKKANEELKDMAVSSDLEGTAQGEAMSQAYTQQGELQESLLRNARNMTEEQKKQAQVLLDINKALEDEAIQAGKTADEMKEQTEELEKQQKRQALRAGKDKENLPSSNDIDQAQNRVKMAIKYQTKFERESKEGETSLDFLKRKNTELGTKEKELVDRQNNIKKKKGEINEKDWTKNYKEEERELQKIEQELKKIKQETKEIQDIQEKIGENEENGVGSNLEDELIESEQNLQKTYQKSGMTKKEATDAVNNYDQSCQDLVNSANDAADANERMGNTAEATEEKLNNFAKAPLTVGDAFTNLGTSIMNIAMVINSVKSLWNIWDNEDISTGEKLIQTMTTLGMLIPTIITLKKTLTAENLKEGASAIYLAAAQAGANLAKAMGIPIDYAKGASGWAALGPAIFFVGIAAVVIGLIAGITAAIISLDNAETEEEKTLRLANEQLERSKKAAEEASQAYEDLKNKISNYDSAIEALEKCTKGTQEWRDAFQEVAVQVSDLIATYPQLLQYEDLYNSDGTLNQKVLQEALELSKQESITASNQQILDQAKVSIAQMGVEVQDNTHNMEKELSFSDFNKNFIESYATQKDKDIATGKDTSSSNYQVVTIDTSQIANEVLQEAKENGIDFYDNDSVKDFVSEYLKTNKPLLTDYGFENATTLISNALVSCAKDIEILDEKSIELATQMANAANIIFDNYFSDKDFKDTNEKIAYQKAYNEISQKEQERTHSGVVYAHMGGFHDIDDEINDENRAEFYKKKQIGKDHPYYSGEWGSRGDFIDLLKDYEKVSGNKVNEKEAVNWSEGKVFVRDSKSKDDKEITIEEVEDQVLNYRLGAAKAEIEALGEEYYKSMDKTLVNAIDNFSVRGNFKEVSYEELSKSVLDEKTGDIKDFEEAFNNNEEAMKQAAANILQKDIKEIEDSDLQIVEGYYKRLAETAKAERDKFPEYLKDFVDSDLINKINLGDIEKVAKMYTDAMAKEGKAGVELLNNIADEAGDEGDEVLAALGNMDFQTTDIDQANKKLADLGLQTRLSGEQFYSLKNIFKEISEVTAETARETYKEVSSVLSKLKAEGDTIEEKDYNKLLEINPAISSYFTQMADGTYMLTGKAEEFKKAVQSASLNELYTAQKNAEDTAVAYGLAQEGKFSSTESLKTKSKNTSTTDFWNNYEDETNAKIKILADNNNQDVNDFQAQINSGQDLEEVVIKVSEAYEKLNIKTDEYSEKASDASERAAELAESIKETQYKNEIENAGLNYETTENYANVLMEVYEAQGLNKDSARNLAIANQRLDKGLSSLNDNFEDWEKSLKNTSKTSAEYAETIGDIRTALANLLNISNADELSASWIEEWIKNSSEMEKILDGNTEALQRFRESAFKEMTTNIFSDMKESVQELEREFEAADEKIPSWLTDLKNQLDDGTFSAENLRNAIQDIGDTAIGAGASLSQDYVDSLNEMLRQGLLTEQQLNDIFSSIGYKPVVTTKVVSQDTFVPEYTTEEYIADTKYVTVGKGDNKETKPVTVKKSKTYQTGGEYMTQQIPVAQIESEDNATGNIKIVNAGSANITPSYSSTSSGKSDSSSSSDNKTTSAASTDYSVNRYSKEENAVNGLTKQLERLSTAKDNAYGNSKIKAIEKEIAKLKELKSAQEDYLDAVVGSGNAKGITQAIYQGKSIGQLIASGQTGGTIKADYQSLFGGASASGKNLEYTAKDSDGNQWLVSDNYSLAGLNSAFGTSLGVQLDSYGNILNKDDLLNIIQRLKNQENLQYASYADPSAGQTTEHNKRIAYLEEFKERLEQYEDTASKLNDLVDEELERVQALQEKNAELISAKMSTGVELGKSSLTRLERAIKLLGDDTYKSVEKMTKFFDIKMNQNQEAYAKQASSYDEAEADIKRRVALYQKNPLDENALSPSKAAEMIQTIEDGRAELYENITSDLEDLKNAYGNVIDYWKEKINKVNKEIEFNVSTLSHLSKVFSLLGKSADYESLGVILDAQVKTSQVDYNDKKRIADSARALYEEHKKVYSKLKTEKQREEYESTILEKDREYLYEAVQQEQAALETSIEAMITQHENNLNKIYKKYEQSLAGEYGTFDNLDQAMKNQQSLADEYLTTTNKVYETNKMLRSISQDIEKTDSRIAKNKLKSFSDEINALQKRDKLTKNDLALAQAKYKVLQAQIALEEARDAKTTVRLKRDSEGNYGYVYTADQDKISNAEQAVEDAENEYYNLNLQQYNDYNEKYLTLKKEYAEQRKALDKLYYEDGLLSEDQYNKALEELNNTFQEKELIYKEAINERGLNLDEIAAEGRTEAWTNSFTETLATQELFNDKSLGAAQDLNSDLQSEMQDWVNAQDELLSKAGLNNEDFKQTVKEVKDEVESLGKQITKKGGFVDQMNQNRSATEKLTEKFILQYQKLENLADKYLRAANEASNYRDKLMSLAEAQRDYNAAISSQPSTNVSNSGGQSYTPTSSGSGNGGSGNSSVDTGGNASSGGGGSKKPTTSDWKKNKTHHWKVKTYPNGEKETINYEKHPWVCYGSSQNPQDGYNYYYYKCKCGATGYKKIKTQLAREYNYTNPDMILNNKDIPFIQMKSGGYTGSWNGANTEENGKLAFLHQKELVLNADDTEKVLSAVKIIRQISQTIDLTAAAQASSMQATAAQLYNSDKTLQQDVTIHAEFPNVQDHNEIETALRNLVNEASQYANRF